MLYFLPMSDTFAKPYECQTDASANPERLAQLEFHLKSGDYFPLLATVLCAVEEGVKRCESGVEHAAEFVDAKVLKSLREDLIYLHKHYAITPKND